MKLAGFHLTGHRSVEDVEFEAGPFTVLFGRNNAGKTNILETILGVLTPENAGLARRTHVDRPSHPHGAVVVELEPGEPYDDAVAEALWAGRSSPSASRVSFTTTGVVGAEPDQLRDEWGIVDPALWCELAVETSVRPEAMLLDWTISGIHERVTDAVELFAAGGRDGPWLEVLRSDDGTFGYRVPARTEAAVSRIATLATDLLPDFVDGSIGAHVTSPTLWGRMPKISLDYEQRGATQCADPVDVAGDGAARWMAVSVQIALRLVRDFPSIHSLREVGDRALSHYVLLIDEPEAHLHPAAVSSMVRWCHRMARHGFNIVIASHHEEFLRAATEDVILVHVTRDSDLVTTTARTLTSSATHHLLELATDVGVHPVTALSLHRAILFVEGPLDEAVLDEYGGLALDAAGVKILPVHGTKNLEGLVAVELVTELGMRLGVLTDATVPDTMVERSNKKRSSEEKKVLRVVQIALEKGIPPPTSFGVPEDDLLFALPVDAIRDVYLKGGQFPEWKELVAECRQELGKSPSDSVNWKDHARQRYGLPIDSPSGVREVVRALDLEGVEIPSVKRVIDEVIAWAMQNDDAL